jgi:hypothetical protein
MMGKRVYVHQDRQLYLLKEYFQYTIAWNYTCGTHGYGGLTVLISKPDNPYP